MNIVVQANKKASEVRKIILSGTHGSGKTTLYNYVKNMNKPNIQIMHEHIRELAKIDGYRFTFDANDENSIYEYCNSEIALTTLYYSLAKSGFKSNTELVVMDRCIIDPTYYATYFNLKLKLPEMNTMRNHINDMINSCINDLKFFNNSIILLLKPLPLDSSDEFRLVGEEIQEGVYKWAVNILTFLDLPFKEVTFDEAKLIINKEINSVFKRNE